jgi:hypothetical protein
MSRLRKRINAYIGHRDWLLAIDRVAEGLESAGQELDAIEIRRLIVRYLDLLDVLYLKKKGTVK